MFKKITLIATILTFVGAFAVVPATSVLAAPKDEITKGLNSAKTGGSADVPTIIQTIVNVLLFITGAVAVIMIVIGGLKYVTSNGDSSQLTSAKNTIMYSVIGLIVAIMAYAIVNFAVAAFTDGGTGGGSGSSSTGTGGSNP